MAFKPRTYEEHYDRIIEFKQQLSQLTGLTPDPDSFQKLNDDLASGSPVSNWRMYIAACAASNFVNEQLIAEIQQELEDRLVDQGIGQENWYARKALEFRYGYSLQFIDEEYRYTQTALADSSALIVKRASAVVEAGQLRVKAAKISSGSVTKLTQSEVDALRKYLDKLNPVGIPLGVISDDPDESAYELDVYFDPQVLNDSGELLSDTSIKPVDEAIKAYIQDLPFDGTWNLNDMIDKVQNARGVVDPRPLKVQARQAGASTWQNLFDVTGSGPTTPKNYRPQAGYMTITSISVNYIVA